MKVDIVVMDLLNILFRVNPIKFEEFTNENSLINDDSFILELITQLETPIINTIKTFYNTFKPTEFYVVADKKVDISQPTISSRYNRKQLYKEYKSGRNKTYSELKNLVISNVVLGLKDTLRETNSDLNIKFIHVPGYEADDIAYTIVRMPANEAKNIILISNDGDWNLNKYPNVGIFKDLYINNFTNLQNLFTDEVLYNKVLMEKTLSGDYGDSIPKTLKYVDKPTLNYLINNYESPETLLENFEQDEKINEKTKIKIRENTPQIKINSKLVNGFYITKDLLDKNTF